MLALSFEEGGEGYGATPSFDPCFCKGGVTRGLVVPMNVSGGVGNW